MTKFIRSAAAPLALLLVLGGCQKNDAAPASRQVELAPAPNGQPQLADTARGAVSPTADVNAGTEALPKESVSPASKQAPRPAPARQPTNAPVSSAPAAVPAPSRTAAAPSAPSAPTTGVIAGGASMSAAMGSRICTNTHRVGDRVTATLASPVNGTNGAVIPAGAAVTLRVTESTRGENGKEGIRLAFEPVSVTTGGATYVIGGSATMTGMETVRAQTTGDQAKKVAAGAVIGALAGKLLGKKNKTAVVGAAVGAAAGGAIAAGSSDWNGCLGEGGRVTIVLSGPLTVQLAR